MFGFPVSGYINSTYSKTGYWFSILSVLLGASILSLVNMEEDEAAATLKALQEYSSSKRDRKNKPQYKMFMKLFRC